MSSGVVWHDAPLAQSTHTVSPALRMLSESTLDTIASMYSSSAPATFTTLPISFHGTHSVPDSYISSIACSSSGEHSVPSAEMHLIPLNSGGLCDAVIITPPVISGRLLM